VACGQNSSKCATPLTVFFVFFFLSQVGLEKGQVLGLGLGLKLHPQPVCFLGSFSGSRL